MTKSIETKEKIQPLSDLNIGDRAVIYKVDTEKAALQFLEMGCLPGEIITLQNKAPLGDPIAIQVAGYKLCLRKEDAQHIYVILEE